MIIQVARIPEEGLRLREEEPETVLDLAEDGEACPSGPVLCDFYLQTVSGSLIVRGTVRVLLNIRCARCMEFFSTTVTDSAFLRDYPGIRGTEEVDITGDIRESILLHLPHFPLCDTACRGLCPECGTNLNRESCDCSEKEAGGIWSALDDFRSGLK